MDDKLHSVKWKHNGVEVGAMRHTADSDWVGYVELDPGKEYFDNEEGRQQHDDHRAEAEYYAASLNNHERDYILYPLDNAGDVVTLYIVEHMLILKKQLTTVATKDYVMNVGTLNSDNESLIVECTFDGKTLRRFLSLEILTMLVKSFGLENLAKIIFAEFVKAFEQEKDKKDEL